MRSARVSPPRTTSAGYFAELRLDEPVGGAVEVASTLERSTLATMAQAASRAGAITLTRSKKSQSPGKV